MAYSLIFPFSFLVSFLNFRYSFTVMNYLLIILSFYIAFFILDFIVEVLNVNYLKETIPSEFSDVYDSDKYAKSQRYLKEKTIFGLIQSTFSIFIFIPFILFGGFNVVDIIVRGFGFSNVITGVIYMFLLILGNQLLSLPFSIYTYPGFVHCSYI